MVRDGKRVQYRDWMTDPADLDSLLNWTNEKLGIHYRTVEADFDHFSYDPRELPALLLSGHNSFQLDAAGPRGAGPLRAGWRDDHRRCLLRLEGFQRFVPARDGGDLSGAAAAQADADDPIFSSYYKLPASFTYQKADGSQYEDEPCLEGIRGRLPDGGRVFAGGPDLRLGRA